MTEPPQGNSEKMLPALQRIIGQVEAEIGVVPGFLDTIWRENDWSFVIKLHALVESVVAYALVDALHAPALSDTFARLPLGGRNGKRAFAAALKVLTRDQDRFVEELSRLRNRMAHDPRDAGLTLAQYLDSLQPKERKNFGAVIAAVLTAGEAVDATMQVSDDGMRLKPEDAPKVSLWFAGMMFIARIYLERFKRENLRKAILGLERAAADSAAKPDER